MPIDYGTWTDPVAGQPRGSGKTEVSFIVDIGDTLADAGARLDAIEGDNATQTELDAHINDTADAHDASAVSIVDVGAYFTGTDVEAALQELGAGGGGGSSAFSGARVTKSATQSIPDSTFTAITFNGESYDTDGYHDNATNNSRLTVPTTGYYAITGLVKFATLSGVANLIGTVYVNGAEITAARTRWNGATSSDNSLPVAVDLSLTAGDYVELYARQTMGGALNAGTLCSFSCRFLGT